MCNSETKNEADWIGSGCDTIRFFRLLALGYAAGAASAAFQS